MGRPREHDDETAAALLVAAERIVEEHGPDALSVRGVAGDVGTTTRAVYSLFGSKEGLIAGLGAHAFDLLRVGVAASPTTAAPQGDLVETGLVFRRFATEHPALFRIAFQSNPSPMRDTPAVREAASLALGALTERIARLDDPGPGLVNGLDPARATLHFHAVCEGLAGLELRCAFPSEAAEAVWREGLSAVVRGLVRPGS
jgi:AcrR family transcriptional regulator